MKFNNIRLLVHNFDLCYAFYNDILGLECTWGKPGENFASFNIGQPSGLALFKAELMAEATNNIGEIINGVLPDKVAIVLQVDHVDDTYNLLKDKGINFLNEPKDMAAWGIRVVHFRDPENNLIELFSDLSGGN